MSAGQTSSQKWYNRKGSAVALAIASGCLAYIMALRAIDTGSLQQYFIALAALIFTGNRLLIVLIPSKRKKHV